MNDILGGAFTSRVNMNLREDKGWSYGADTIVVDTQAQRPFLAIAPVQADQTAASMQEINGRSRSSSARATRPTAEVATSKRRSTLTLPGRWETARAVARDIAELVRFELPDDYWHDYAELVSGSTSRRSTPRRSGCSHPEQLTWVVVGDLGVIEPRSARSNSATCSIVDADGNPADQPMNVL